MLKSKRDIQEKAAFFLRKKILEQHFGAYPMVEEQRGLRFPQHEGAEQAQSAGDHSTICVISGC
jgi:hypothetical protein